MEKLTVKLKQHTPLIHFQHYQENPTLRASEVKPRLDRYILETLGNGNYDAGCEQASRNGWIIGENALKYKLRIRPISEIRVFDTNTPQIKKGVVQRNKDNIIKLNPYPAYFANLDSNYENVYEYKRFSFCKYLLLDFVFVSNSLGQNDKIILSDLYEYIIQPGLLSSFFINNNFGARSSKGFGSFYIDEEDNLFQEPNSKNWFSIKVGGKNVSEDSRVLFNAIDLFYKSLRSGINDKDREGETIFYFKSLIYKYCKDILAKDWDKKRIKEFFIDNIINNDNCVDIKDVLGFSTCENWRSYNLKIRKEIVPSDNGRDVPARMQSPILFKPIYTEYEEGNYFDIYIRSVSKRVGLNNFLSSGRVKVCNGNNNFFIDLPSEFNVLNFFDYIFDNLNFDISTHVEEIYHDNDKYKILEDIFEQIKDNR